MLANLDTCPIICSVCRRARISLFKVTTELLRLSRIVFSFMNAKLLLFKNSFVQVVIRSDHFVGQTQLQKEHYVHAYAFLLSHVAFLAKLKPFQKRTRSAEVGQIASHRFGSDPELYIGLVCGLLAHGYIAVTPLRSCFVAPSRQPVVSRIGLILAARWPGRRFEYLDNFLIYLTILAE